MKRLSCLLSCLIVALLFLVLVVPLAYAVPVPIWGSDATEELIGSRSSSGGGINTTGTGWPEFRLDWDVSLDSDTGYWTYCYIVAVEPTPTGQIKDLSHLIIEVTDFGNDGSPFFTWTGGDPTMELGIPEEYSGGTNWPNSIYGIKFEGYGAGEFGVDDYDGMWLYGSVILTLNEPVYGVFAAKDGRHDGIPLYAWSTALDFENYKTNETLTANNFIVRPDGTNGGLPPIPEPATILLLSSGVIGIGGAGGVFRKKKK